jgi:hypothetical protein
VKSLKIIFWIISNPSHIFFQQDTQRAPDSKEEVQEEKVMEDHLEAHLDLLKDMEEDLALTQVTQGLNHPKEANGHLQKPTVVSTIQMGPTVAYSSQSKMVESEMLATKNYTYPPLGIKEQVLEEEKYWGLTPLYQRLQKRLSWWVQHASPQVVEVIKHGIKPPWVHPPPLSAKSNPRGEQDLQQVQTILTTYQESGAIKVVEDFNSRHLIPWFLISKQEGGGPNGD